MSESGRWTERQVREFLQREKPTGQKLDLPFGLSTEGRDLSEVYDVAFPEKLEGKTVLDVSSNLGGLCNEALARGAGDAVGWEADSSTIRQARTIADIVGSPARYFQHDIERMDRPEEARFDIVVALNVLDRVSDPITVLDKLIRLTRETLVLELPSLEGNDDRGRLKMPARESANLRKSPVIYVTQAGTTPPHDQSCKAYFTKSALRNLLEFQRHHFAKVDFVDVDEGRFFVVARRRRIKHLVVVAGPQASGKSTLTRAIQNGNLPELSERLGIADLSGWPKVDTNRLRTFQETSSEGLILNYSLTRPFLRSTKTYADDEALDILSGADRVSMITLLVSPQRLQRQMGSREGSENNRRSGPTLVGRMKSMARRGLPNGLKRWVKLRISIPADRRKNTGWDLTSAHGQRLKQILTAYKDPSEVVKIYRQWFEFVDSAAPLINDHLVVEYEESLKIGSVNDWEAMLQDSESSSLPRKVGVGV